MAVASLLVYEKAEAMVAHPRPLSEVAAEMPEVRWNYGMHHLSRSCTASGPCASADDSVFYTVYHAGSTASMPCFGVQVHEAPLGGEGLLPIINEGTGGK
jgi:hypothetical protein